MTILAQSIPASDYVQVNPGVVSAGGNALDLNGVILTQATSVPIGTVEPFASAPAVSDFFGPTSVEYDMAAVYFAGRNNATVTPANLFVAQYNADAVAAYTRSASLSSMSLATLQGQSGTLTVTINGTGSTSSSVDLSAATSFSDAATIIQSAFTSPAFSVSYDTQLSAFVITTSSSGASETIDYCAGALADALYLTQATGAVLSQGADPTTPADTMNAVYQQTLNWAAFTTTWEPVHDDKLAFSKWISEQNNRFAYVGWDTNAVATQFNENTSWMAAVKSAGYSGSIGVYVKDATQANHAAFVLGVTASLDFARTNGRTNYAYKYTSGLMASVTDETTANNLNANGYNYIGAVATANQGFTYFYNGQISGPFKWIDTYMDQVYLNSQLQLSVMELLTNVNFIPYNQRGYTQIHAACMDPINQGLNFGSIVPGVSLSALQASEVNTAAGQKIDDVLSNRGWYLQINDATAQVRGDRGSPPITLFYMDGGSVNKVVLASIVVQ